MMKSDVSIIIPTLNEAQYLPKLLESIRLQSVAPREIIVVDARSKDPTPVIAKEYGCEVISDDRYLGHIGGSRNLGAKAASGEWLLFLDADVLLTPDFIEKAVKEGEERQLDIATCFAIPLSSSKIDKAMHDIANVYMNLTYRISAHAGGYCILVKKSLHERINGFDASLTLGEDHDYAARASKAGKFGYLKSCFIQVSVRRQREEGRTNLAIKYVSAEVYRLLFGNIKKNIFKYKFGEHFK